MLWWFALNLLRGLASKNGYFRALLFHKCLIFNDRFFKSACSADLPPCGAFSRSGFIRNVPPLTKTAARMAKITCTGVSSKTAVFQLGASSSGGFFTWASSMADRRPPGARRSNSSVRIPTNRLRSLFLTKTMHPWKPAACAPPVERLLKTRGKGLLFYYPMQIQASCTQTCEFCEIYPVSRKDWV
jgi:hypothetical protein